MQVYKFWKAQITDRYSPMNSEQTERAYFKHLKSEKLEKINFSSGDLNWPRCEH